MVLQHAQWENHVITIILLNAKVGIFPLSYAVILLSFIPCVSLLFIAWLPNFNILVCSVFL